MGIEGAANGHYLSLGAIFKRNWGQAQYIYLLWREVDAAKRQKEADSFSHAIQAMEATDRV